MNKIKNTTSVLGSLILGLSIITPSGALAESISLSDVSHHWAKETIQSWVDKGMARGYEDGSFKPNHSITRAEFMALVNQSFGLTEKVTVSFSDVSEKDWFSGEVAKAAKAGYISGFEDGTINPKASITRQEVAAILSKLLHGETADQNILKQYKDQELPQWSRNAISAVVSKGIMSGYPNQTFMPKKSITRAEAIVTLDKALQSKENQPKETQQNTSYDLPGTYGPSKGSTTINGDVTINAADVVLQNTVIMGNLVLGNKIGEGDVKLNNVVVKGTTLIQGGGENSIIIKDSTLANVTVNKKSGKVRVVASGKTVMPKVKLESGAKLEELDLTGVGYSHLELSSSLPSQSNVILSGQFDKVDVLASNVTVEVKSGVISEFYIGQNSKDNQVRLASQGTIKELILGAAVRVSGEGTIEKAEGDISGSTFEKAPLLVESTQASPGSVGGGGVTVDQSKPTATNISLGDARFTGTGNVLNVYIDKNENILDMYADFNMDTNVEILIGGTSYASFSQGAGTNQNIPLLNQLGLDRLDGDGKGIPARHFADYVTGSDTGQGTLTIVVKLKSGNKENVYTLNVNIN